MTIDQIRIALEDAVGIPEEALREAAVHAAELAPVVIAVAQDFVDGRMPLPKQERLLRFGLHALSAARETSVCPVFLTLLRLPAVDDDAGAEALEPKQRWEMIDSLGALVGAIERSESRAQ